MDSSSPPLVDATPQETLGITESRRLVPHRRPWHKVLLQLIRPFHLYAGLLMLPWALLYGVTGFLFNHPGAFVEQTKIPFGSTDLEDTPLTSLPSPAEAAQQTVAAINAQGKGTYHLVEADSARFEGDIRATVRDADGKRYTVTIAANNAGGTIVPQPMKEAAPQAAPFAGTLKAESPAAQPVKQGLPIVLEKVGLAGTSVTEVHAPAVSFRMEGDGKVWRVTYHPSAKRVFGQPVDAAAANMGTRRFLLHLHLARGYPAEVNSRWVWAVLVDAMAVVMVFWGFSGLLMWWQIKSTRWFGLAVVLASAAAATWSAVAMHSAFTGQ